MRNPIAVLKSLTEKSKDVNYKFQRLYRNLYNPDFYWLAHKNIYANKGSMTVGVDGSTMDNMSDIRIEKIISSLKSGGYKPNPGVPEHILPRLRPYDLRHRYASATLQKWLDEGRNLYAMLPYLRTYMGHERFSDTAYYIHILPENLLRSPGVDWDAIDKPLPEVDVWKH